MTTSPDDEGPGLPVTPRVLTRASIVTPGDWSELDLDPATRHTSIRRAVRQAIVRSRSLAPDAVALIALLDRTTNLAVDAGAFYCASRVIEDATRVIVATVLMQVCRSATAPLPGSPILTVRQRCAALGEVISKDPEWAGADIRVVALPIRRSCGTTAHRRQRGHRAIPRAINRTGLPTRCSHSPAPAPRTRK